MPLTGSFPSRNTDNRKLWRHLWVESRLGGKTDLMSPVYQHVSQQIYFYVYKTFPGQATPQSNVKISIRN